MSPELVTLMGEEIGTQYINDDVYAGGYSGEIEGEYEGDNQLQVLGYDDVSNLLGSIESFFNKVKGAVQGGYGIQTPQGRLSISEQGVQYTQNQSNLPMLPQSSGAMSIIKNPMVLGGAALVVLFLLMKKKRR